MKIESKKRGFRQQEWAHKQRLQPERDWDLMGKLVNELRVILTSIASPYQRFLMCGPVVICSSQIQDRCTMG